MPSRHPALSLVPLSAASALLAAAVGMSYVYVDLSLNRMGETATAIGLNAAMPALGWLLATPLLPWALRRCNSKALILALLAVAGLAILGFPVWPDAQSWMVLRFLFGGAAGLVFRLVEYWINAASPETHRARNVGIYAAAFAAGAMAGGLVSPLVGVEGWPPAWAIAALTAAAALVFATLRGGPPRLTQAPPRPSWRRYGGGAFIALAGVVVLGLYEAIPYTLMPVYSVRQGVADHWALWCAAAAVGGQIIMAAPVGILADRHGKIRALAWSAAICLVIPAAIPAAIAHPPLLLVAMLIWGGFAGSLYNVALAMLADRFEGAELAAANAAFGTLYALGSLCGPPIHGLAMDWWPPQGLMVSAAGLFALFLCALAWQARRVSA